MRATMTMTTFLAMMTVLLSSAVMGFSPTTPISGIIQGQVMQQQQQQRQHWCQQQQQQQQQQCQFGINLDTVCRSTPMTTTSLWATGENGDTAEEQKPSDMVAKRIILVGDVDGGYYRSCVLNEVRRALCVFCLFG